MHFTKIKYFLYFLLTFLANYECSNFERQTDFKSPNKEYTRKEIQYSINLRIYRFIIQPPQITTKIQIRVQIKQIFLLFNLYKN